MAPNASLLLFISLLILNQPHQTTATVSFTQLRTLLSLSHSLSTRVANLRSSRGDYAGARRAELIASKLEHGLGLRSWPTILSMGWDYLKNYAWRGGAVSFQDAFGFAADVNQLLSSLTELARLRNDSERAAWVGRNYQNILGISKSMFNRLLSVFSKSGPLRDLVEILQKEMEGDFLKDCLEVGANDLKGLVQVLKDLASHYTSSDKHQEL